MSRIGRFAGAGITALALSLVVSGVSAQPAPLQSLKDAWVGSTQDLYQIDYDKKTLVLKTPADNAPRAFQAIAFEQPTLGGSGSAARNLIALDGTRLLRYADGTDETSPPTELFDASTTPSSLRTVTAIAVTDTGSVLFSGFSRPKRVFELWELTEVPNPPPAKPTIVVELRATGTPNMTDATYVRAEDVVPQSALAGGGLLAAAGQQLLFFSADSGFTLTELLNTKVLGLKGNTQLLSVDLVRKTDVLMIATSERTVLTSAVQPTSYATTFAALPDLGACRNLRPQRILVRNARGGSEATSIVSDLCGQVLRYDFSNPYSQSNLASATVYGSGLTVLAVGEGSEITCDPNVDCPLTSGLTTKISSLAPAELLVLQFDDLCDRRVAPLTCQVGDVEAGHLVLNSLLPPSVRDSIDPRVTIKLPPYMSSSSQDGRFGVVLVQADPASASSAATIELEYVDLAGGVKLGVATGLPRTTQTLPLLNQDVAAYAPDNYELPTVRGFEATPITTGFRNPMTGGLRGFSVIFYGLQHDVYPPSPRALTGGISPDFNAAGATPLCPNLTQGVQVFSVINTPERYFANLAACLFSDLESLLATWIPATALSDSDRASLQAVLGNTKDKLIKAFNASGPNSGSENFQSVLSQLDNFDSAVASTTFNAAYVIYKNELLVRSKVFRFNLMERAYPSLPAGGF